MRALRYFPQEVLCNLESVLFGEISHSAKITYCLINEHQKCYYISSTVNTAGLIARLRTAAMKAEYKVMATYVQNTASVSNMSDWVLAVFAPNYHEHQADEVLKALRFEKLHKAARYEINSIDTAQIYQATHKRHNVAVAFSTTAAEPSLIVNSRAIKSLKSRLLTLEARGMDRPGHQAHDYYWRVKAAANHSFAEEWTLVPLERKESQTMQSQILALNNNYINHLN